MARAKTVIVDPIAEEAAAEAPVAEVVETPIEEVAVEEAPAEPVVEAATVSITDAPADPATRARAAAALGGAPLDVWAGTYAKVGLIGLRYDNGGVHWTTLGSIDPANVDTVAQQRALDGNYQTLLYVSDTFEVLFSTSRVDAAPFTAA
jgi:hypothetical protein